MESIREALFYFLISIISLHQHSGSTVYYYLLYYYNDGGARFISILKKNRQELDALVGRRVDVIWPEKKMGEENRTKLFIFGMGGLYDVVTAQLALYICIPSTLFLL